MRLHSPRLRIARIRNYLSTCLGRSFVYTQTLLTDVRDAIHGTVFTDEYLEAFAIHEQDFLVAACKAAFEPRCDDYGTGGPLDAQRLLQFRRDIR